MFKINKILNRIFDLRHEKVYTINLRIKTLTKSEIAERRGGGIE